MGLCCWAGWIEIPSRVQTAITCIDKNTFPWSTTRVSGAQTGPDIGGPSSSKTTFVGMP